MKHNLLIIGVISVAVLAGCQQQDSGLLREGDVVLVEVDGKPVTKAMLEFLMETRGVAEDDIEGMRRLFDELVRLQAVANAASREGISEQPEVRAERMLRDIEIQYVRYLEHWQKAHPFSDEDIAAVYQQQLERSGDTRWRLETIDFDDQVAADRTLQALMNGEMTFSEAIEQATAEQRLARRTDWVDASQVPPSFVPLLKETGDGAVVPELMPYQGKWLIVRVVSSEPLTPPSLDEVREGIRRQLLRERMQAMMEIVLEQAEIVPMLPLEGDARPDDGAPQP